MRKLKLGILGCGGAALAIHLPILSRLNDKFTLAAVCDQFPERADKTAARFDIGKQFSNLDKMLQESFDMLVILSLNHEEPIEAGLAAKKHIFTEKPISLDINKSQSLKDKAVETGLLLEVGLMRFYDPLVQKLNQEMDVKTIDSGIFYKYDGSDASFRELLLPSGMDAYTFQKNKAPEIPQGLNETQLFVLKTLLWSGIHQLSVMLSLFEELNVVACRVDRNLTSLSCLFETRLGKQMMLNIGSTELPLYEEKMILFGKTQKAELTFSSPYSNISQSNLAIFNTDGKNIQQQNFNYYESAFEKMWKKIYDSVLENSRFSLDFALKVEKLAAAAAEMATI